VLSGLNVPNMPVVLSELETVPVIKLVLDGPVLGEIAADMSLDGHTRREIKEFRLSRFTDSSVHRLEVMI
jgi:hypothetical protein